MKCEWLWTTGSPCGVNGPIWSLLPVCLAALLSYNTPWWQQCSGISRFGHHVAGNCQFWIANFFSGPISGRLHFREPCLHVLCQFCALFSIYMATRVDKHCALLLPQLPLIQFSWRKYQGFQWKKFIFFFVRRTIYFEFGGDTYK